MDILNLQMIKVAAGFAQGDVMRVQGIENRPYIGVAKNMAGFMMAMAYTAGLIFNAREADSPSTIVAVLILFKPARFEEAAEDDFRADAPDFAVGCQPGVELRDFVGFIRIADLLQKIIGHKN